VYVDPFVTLIAQVVEVAVRTVEQNVGVPPVVTDTRYPVIGDPPTVVGAAQVMLMYSYVNPAASYPLGEAATAVIVGAPGTEVVVTTFPSSGVTEEPATSEFVTLNV
jgi:hypothetical protein